MSKRVGIKLINILEALKATFPKIKKYITVEERAEDPDNEQRGGLQGNSHQRGGCDNILLL